MWIMGVWQYILTEVTVMGLSVVYLKEWWEDNIKQYICQFKIQNWIACIQVEGNKKRSLRRSKLSTKGSSAPGRRRYLKEWMGLIIKCCGMTVKRMGMLGVSVSRHWMWRWRQWHWLVKVEKNLTCFVY
jgi:hypothetical protein